MNKSTTLALAMDLHRILRELPTASALDSGQDLRGAIWKLTDYAKRSDLARELLPVIRGLSNKRQELWAKPLEATIRQLLSYAGGAETGPNGAP